VSKSERRRKGRGPGKPPFREAVHLSEFTRSDTADETFARVRYTRGAQRIVDTIIVSGYEVHANPPEAWPEKYEAQLECSIASCRDCAWTPSERARKARIRQLLRRKVGRSNAGCVSAKRD
jgi:hypothetical protein